MITLNDAQIIGLVEHSSFLATLEAAFRNPASTPPRAHHQLTQKDDATLLIMPSWQGKEAIGVKVITVVPANTLRGEPTINGLYLLFDGETGSLLATLSARTLTALRTAGVSALAASKLARQESKVLLMLGTGHLIPYLIDAFLTIRSLEQVVIWGRDPDKAKALAHRLARAEVSIKATEDLATALRHADIVSSATAACEPLVHGAKLAAGTHVDLVGSFTPAMREADTELFRNARLVVDCANAFEESGDVIAPLREGVIAQTAPDLTALLTQPSRGRQSPADITVFKAVGTGLADLAAARYFFRKANDTRGRSIYRSR